MKKKLISLLGMSILLLGIMSCNQNPTDPHRIITLGCCQVIFKNISSSTIRVYLVSKSEPFPLRHPHVAVEDFRLIPGEYKTITTTDTLNIAYPVEPLFSTILNPIDVSKVTSFAPVAPGKICELTGNTVAIYPGQ